MKLWQRWLIAIVIVIVDSAVVFIPLSALLLAFVVVAQPEWAWKAVLRIYNIPYRGRRL